MGKEHLAYMILMKDKIYSDYHTMMEYMAKMSFWVVYHCWYKGIFYVAMKCIANFWTWPVLIKNKFLKMLNLQCNLNTLS
jgi:hypothetical protein